MRTTALIAALSIMACDAPAPAPARDAGADAGPDGTVRPAPEGFRARIAPDGTLTVETGRVTLAGFDLVVRTVQGTAIALSTLHPTVTGGHAAARTADGLDVALDVTPAEGTAQGAVVVAWSVSGAGRVRGVDLRAPSLALPADARAVVDGAQSWSFTGALALEAGAALARDASGEVAWPARLGDPLLEAPGLGFFRGDLAWSGGGLSLCARAPYDRWTAVSFERPGDAWAVRVAAGLMDDEAVSLSARGPALTGSLVLAPADGARPFACSADAPPPARTRPARAFPRGWWSWNTLFDGVTAASVVANAAAMRALDPGATHVTVDDGWERLWGDWTPKPLFGASLDALSADLARQGTTLGLWLAPFAVDPAAPLAAQHPEWMVRAPGGGPLRVELVPGRPYQVLDATHPEARAHLEALFRGLRAQGVSLFKIDFLYAAALPGLRADATATGLQAYRMGLDAIARGAGDAHINGCGAVVLPALAYVDSMRVGADNTFSVARPFWGAIAAAARNLAARSDLARWGVQPDPDQPVTRELPPDEARAFLAVGLLSGAAFGYGDDLTALDDARRGLYREPWFTRLRDNTRGVARALDADAAVGEAFYTSPLIESLTRGLRTTRVAPPSRFAVDLGAQGTAIVLFNWRDEAREGRVAVADLAAATVRELVTDVAPQRDGPQWVVTLPPRAVRVLAAQR